MNEKWSEFKKRVDDELTKNGVDDAEIECFDFGYFRRLPPRILYNAEHNTLRCIE